MRVTRDIYLIRHGATKLNAESSGHSDVIRGTRDVPLDAQGRAEAGKLACELAESGIDIIISSPLSRAADTAAEIARTTGASIELDGRFIPMHLGQFTGLESSVVIPQLVRYAIEDPDLAVPDGESFNSFRSRVFAGLRNQLPLHLGRIMAIVTHHRVERLIHAWIEKGSPSSLAIDYNVMFSPGECPGHSERVRVDYGSLLRRRPRYQRDRRAI